VANGLVLLWNESAGHHNQFTSDTCPGGWGGSHYSVRHTVCPTDIEHLTYPLRDTLGDRVTEESLRADAEVYIPITCKENAGMTTPVHTIVLLEFGDEAGASAEFHRAMHGACYSPFLVRNEVDKHLDVPGGHFDNTHFVTGDGGMLQAMLYGYGGMRIVPPHDGATVKLLKPALPSGVNSFRLRITLYETYSVEISVTRSGMEFQVKSSTMNNEGKRALCISSVVGGTEHRAVPGESAVHLPMSFMWPGYVQPCSEIGVAI